MSENLSIFLVERPEGDIKQSHFRKETVSMPEAGEGQLLVKNQYLSLDPYLRSKIAGKHMSGGVAPGELMAGETVGEVLTSNHPDFAVGDMVHAHSGWCSYAAIDAAGARKVNTHGLPLSLALGILGMPGLTAYAGIERLSNVKAGDTFVVTAASGPVGSLAAQLARLKGARTVGIVGSDEKANWILNEAKFDAAINYKTEDIRAGLDRTCPDKINVYFDAVGGDVLEAVCERLALEANLVLYGLISQYSMSGRIAGPPPGHLIIARAHMHGLVVYDHEDLRQEMEEKCSAWIKSGDIAVNEEVHEGLENAPAAFERLMAGQNFGKSLVKI